MNTLPSRIIKPLKNQRGDMSINTCFFIVVIVAFVSFVLLYASFQINVINIQNGIKMELNNLSATIYADTFRSQRESNHSELIRTLYTSPQYTQMLENTVKEGLAQKIDLSNPEYRLSNIRLEFNIVNDRIEYAFLCDAEFFTSMFGNSYTILRKPIRITGYHNTKY